MQIPLRVDGALCPPFSGSECYHVSAAGRLLTYLRTSSRSRSHSRKRTHLKDAVQWFSFIHSSAKPLPSQPPTRDPMCVVGGVPIPAHPHPPQAVIHAWICLSPYSTHAKSRHVTSFATGFLSRNTVLSRLVVGVVRPYLLSCSAMLHCTDRPHFIHPFIR